MYLNYVDGLLCTSELLGNSHFGKHNIISLKADCLVQYGLNFQFSSTRVIYFSRHRMAVTILL